MHLAEESENLFRLRSCLAIAQHRGQTKGLVEAQTKNRHICAFLKQRKKKFSVFCATQCRMLLIRGGLSSIQEQNIPGADKQRALSTQRSSHPGVALLSESRDDVQYFKLGRAASMSCHACVNRVGRLATYFEERKIFVRHQNAVCIRKRCASFSNLEDDTFKMI